MDPITIAAAVVAALLGVGCAVLASRLTRSAASLAATEARLETLTADHESRLAQAERHAEVELKQAISDAKERLVVENRATQERVRQEESRLKERSAELDRRGSRAERREEDLQGREARLSEREGGLRARGEELEGLLTSAREALEAQSGLTAEQAREQLIEQVEKESRSALARRIKQVEAEVEERAEATAKNIISMAIQRYAGEYVCERTVSVVSLPSDELKGRIIGREGRNIRALEAATGVDFIIDDTPETIVISAYNPIRREVARRALETLLEDGRIHPSRIEGVVRKAEAEFHKIIRAAGEEAAEEVGVGGVHPEILKLVGALKYRTSYGQNQWQHAIEVAFLSGMMADELGFDARVARRAGLLHDIGKVLDQTAEGSHALIGAEFARKHGETDLVCNAIAAHHEEVPQQTVYAVLAQAADAISGARPGARREMMQTYTKRLSDLERISNSFPGVGRSYAVQAGREIRVLVENADVSDEEAVLLSQGIARKIESEMSYPGQIKVTVIRETRVVQYAR